MPQLRVEAADFCLAILSADSLGQMSHSEPEWTVFSDVRTGSSVLAYLALGPRGLSHRRAHSTPMLGPIYGTYRDLSCFENNCVLLY